MDWLRKLRPNFTKTNGRIEDEIGDLQNTRNLGYKIPTNIKKPNEKEQADIESIQNMIVENENERKQKRKQKEKLGKIIDKLEKQISTKNISDEEKKKLEQEIFDNDRTYNEINNEIIFLDRYIDNSNKGLNKFKQQGLPLTKKNMENINTDIERYSEVLKNREAASTNTFENPSSLDKEYLEYNKIFSECKKSDILTRKFKRGPCKKLSKYKTEYHLTMKNFTELNRFIILDLVKHLSEKNNRPYMSYRYKEDLKIILKAIVSVYYVETSENDQKIKKHTNKPVPSDNYVINSAYDYLTKENISNYLSIMFEIVSMYEGKDISHLPSVHGRMKVIHGILKYGPHGYWKKSEQVNNVLSSSRFKKYENCNDEDLYCNYKLLFEEAGVSVEKMPEILQNTTFINKSTNKTFKYEPTNKTFKDEPTGEMVELENDNEPSDFFNNELRLNNDIDDELLDKNEPEYNMNLLSLEEDETKTKIKKVPENEKEIEPEIEKVQGMEYEETKPTKDTIPKNEENTKSNSNEKIIRDLLTDRTKSRQVIEDIKSIYIPRPRLGKTDTPYTSGYGNKYGVGGNRKTKRNKKTKRKRTRGRSNH